MQIDSTEGNDSFIRPCYLRILYLLVYVLKDIAQLGKEMLHRS